MTSHQKKIFFRFSLFLVLVTIFARFENFSPIWLFWIFIFFVHRNNSEWWRPKTKSCISGWPDGQSDDGRTDFNLLVAEMAEIWSSDGFVPITAAKIQREKQKSTKKNCFFFKNKKFGSMWCILAHYLRPSDLGAHFISTSLAILTGEFERCHIKREFWSLLVDLGHFLTSDVILKENFCRLASISLIDLMKLFALGRIDSAVA